MKPSMAYGTQPLEVIAPQHQSVRALATTIQGKYHSTHVMVISATSIQILAPALLVLMRRHAGSILVSIEPYNEVHH
jgi:hypothetical protein